MNLIDAFVIPTSVDVLCSLCLRPIEPHQSRYPYDDGDVACLACAVGDDADERPEDAPA